MLFAGGISLLCFSKLSVRTSSLTLGKLNRCVRVAVGMFRRALFSRLTIDGRKLGEPKMMRVFLVFAVFAVCILFLGGFRAGFICGGVSMEPNLSADSFVFGFVPDSISDIHVGDVVAYEWNGLDVVHRVTAIYGEEIHCFGDANLSEEGGQGEAIRFEQVKFVVTGHIPFLVNYFEGD